MTSAQITMPAARGPWSAWVLERIRSAGAPSGVDAAAAMPDTGLHVDGGSEDVQLALYLCYELQYTGLPGTEPLEWDPQLISARRSLEDAFEARLRHEIGADFDASGNGRAGAVDPGAIGPLIRRLLDDDQGPSLSRHMERHGSLDQMRDIVLHRSPYQLKEGDPHAAGIQRLDGRAKQLLVMIQAGEYGADAPGRRTHAALFADTMVALGLDPTPNAHLDLLPASSLAISNLITLFGCNRRWRGALVGQLAAFEMTSVVPMGRYARGLERLGAPRRARRFYEVHVLADAEHEEWALQMVEAQCRAEPPTAGDVVFGVRATLVVEGWFARTLFAGWSASARVASPPHLAPTG